MRSHRGGWLGSCLLGAILVVAPAASTTVHAQPGFGPDPFWPYNHQYTPYTTAIGPADPIAGQGYPAMPRQGYATANQFQQYLEGLSSPGRNVSDRSGVGVPYYRGSVDPRLGGREYQPNAGSNKAFEETQREVTEKYFKYFSEPDPRKRAELLKDYQRARRSSKLALSPRAQSPSRVLDAGAQLGAESGSSRVSARPRDAMSGAVPLPHEPGTTSRGGNSATRSSIAGSARGSGRATRPAPPVPSIAPSQGGGRSRISPNNVLNRARNMDAGVGRTPGSSTARPRNRRTDQSGQNAARRTAEEP